MLFGSVFEHETRQMGKKKSLHIRHERNRSREKKTLFFWGFSAKCLCVAHRVKETNRNKEEENFDIKNAHTISFSFNLFVILCHDQSLWLAVFKPATIVWLTNLIRKI